jgi:hypothetical protein
MPNISGALSSSITFGATRHPSLIGNHSAEENVLDSRLRGNDEVKNSA